MQTLRLVIEIVLIVLRWCLDPERLKTALDERLERERQTREQQFRKALDAQDADAVSGMLSDLRRRLRGKDDLSDRR